ncbi:MAG: nuclear transport factor 2 family protein [Pseudomonadota bacterium]
MSNNNLSTVLAYYAAINQKQVDLAAEKLADNVSIISPLDEKHGKTEVVNALKGFCSAVESVSIRAKFSKDNQVMLAYDILFPKPVGHLRAAGLITLDQNLITNIELFYDGRVVQAKKDEIFS